MLSWERIEEICKEERVPLPVPQFRSEALMANEDYFRWICACMRDGNNALTRDPKKWV